MSTLAGYIHAEDLADALDSLDVRPEWLTITTAPEQLQVLARAGIRRFVEWSIRETARKDQLQAMREGMARVKAGAPLDGDLAAASATIDRLLQEFDTDPVPIHPAVAVLRDALTELIEDGGTLT